MKTQEQLRGSAGWQVPELAPLDMGIPLQLVRAKQGAPGCERRQKRRQKPPKTAAKVPGHRVTVVIIYKYFYLSC